MKKDILIFLGIPPIYAIANGANNILAASVSGTLGHWFKDQLDIKMGLLIVIGGVFGSIIGIILFRNLLAAATSPDLCFNRFEQSLLWSLS